jgi:hypothetical protein
MDIDSIFNDQQALFSRREDVVLPPAGWADHALDQAFVSGGSVRRLVPAEEFEAWMEPRPKIRRSRLVNAGSVISDFTRGLHPATTAIEVSYVGRTLHQCQGQQAS